MSNPIYSYSDNPLYKDRALDNPSWSKVLFNDRPLQASELIEIQTIQQRSTHRSLSTLIKNGSVIKGLTPLVTETPNSIEIQITPGLFYLDGFCIEVEGKSFSIDKLGKHELYIHPEEKIITELDDPSLRDTNTGGHLYGREGAARLLWTASVRLNEVSDYPLLTVRDGVISGVIENLGSRDLSLRDRYGDFILEGFVISLLESGVNAISPITVEDEQKSTERLNELELEERRQKSILNSLKKELDYLSSISNPTHDVLKRLEDLDLLIRDRTKLISDLSQTLIEYRASLYRRPLTNYEQDFFKKIQIGPGIAYVDGYRVSKDSATTITYNHSLPEINVEARPFTFFNNPLFNTRYVRYGSHLKNMGDCLAMGFVLYLNFSNLNWMDTSVSIRTSFTFNRDVEIYSLEELVKYLVDAFSSNGEIPSNQSFNSLSDLSPQLLRSIIRDNIRISVLDDANLYFEQVGTTTLPIQIETKSSNLLVQFDRERTSINHKDISQERSFYLGEDIKEIKSIVVVARYDSIPVVRGSDNTGLDRLPDDSIISITKVEQQGVIYIEGRDYFLNRNSVSWATSGEDSTRPEYGSTYYVSFTYTKLIENFLIQDGFLQFNAEKPEDSSTFYVTYSYYQPRVELLHLLVNGDLVVGSNTGDGLALAEIVLTSKGATINPLSNRRWTSKDIEDLRREILANRDSLSLLAKEIRYGKDNNSILDSSIDWDNSTAVINSSTQSYGLPLSRKDRAMDYPHPYLINPSVSVELESKYDATNYLDIGASIVPHLRVSPRVSLLNNNSIQARSIIHPVNEDSWFIESDVRAYLGKEKDEIKYEITKGIATQDPSILATTRVLIEAIGLPPLSRNYYIEVDGQRLNSTHYILEDDSRVGSNNLITANERGEISISIRVELSAGLHQVSIKNGTHQCSSFISVLDVRSITNFISAHNNWNLAPLAYNSIQLPEFPANRNSELLPPLLQEFKVDEDLYLAAVSIDVDPTKVNLVLGASNDRGPSPTFLTRLSWDRGDKFNLDKPYLLGRDRTYYIGVIPISNTRVPIYRSSQRSIDSSLIIESMSTTFLPLQLTDGYFGTYLDNTSLVFSLHKAVFQRERLFDLGTYPFDRPVRAFSINARTITPSHTKVEFFYKRETSLIPVNPFHLVNLDIPISELSLRAKLTGTDLVSPFMDVSGGSLSITTLSDTASQAFTLQSLPITLPPEYTSIELRVEHVGEIDVDSVELYNSTHWIKGSIRDTSTRDDLITSYYTFDVSNELNSVKYRVISRGDIRNVEVLTYV